MDIPRFESWSHTGCTFGSYIEDLATLASMTMPEVPMSYVESPIKGKERLA